MSFFNYTYIAFINWFNQLTKYLHNAYPGKVNLNHELLTHWRKVISIHPQTIQFFPWLRRREHKQKWYRMHLFTMAMWINKEKNVNTIVHRGSLLVWFFKHYLEKWSNQKKKSSIHKRWSHSYNHLIFMTFCKHGHSSCVLSSLWFSFSQLSLMSICAQHVMWMKTIENFIFYGKRKSNWWRLFYICARNNIMYVHASSHLYLYFIVKIEKCCIIVLQACRDAQNIVVPIHKMHISTVEQRKR